jgi:sec-independent protein translocase protein TatB
VFDIAWSELALIAAVALIVIGPRDLPRVMRTVGQWTRQARQMAAEFQRNLDDMMHESEMQDLRREVESIAPVGLQSKLEEMVDVKAIRESLEMPSTPAPLPPDPLPDLKTELPLAGPPETEPPPAGAAAQPTPERQA